MQSDKDAVFRDLDIAESSIKRAIQAIKSDEDISGTDCYRLLEVAIDYMSDFKHDYVICQVQFSRKTDQ